MKKILLICSAFIVSTGLALPVLAQDEPTAPENRFLLTGYGFTTFTIPDAEEEPNSFAANFVPIFLYRVSDRFLFESELEFEFEDEQVEVGVEYAQIDWLANDNMTVVMGKFLTPFGSFIEKLHPAWINKLPTFPLPYEHGQSLVPFGQFGVQVRGGVPIGDGNRRFTYSVYVSNGVRVSAHGDEEEGEIPDEHDEGEETNGLGAASGTQLAGGQNTGFEEGGHGEDNDLTFFDAASFNANDKLGYGGRVAVVPLRGFEIGASYLTSTYDELGTLDTTAYGLDFTYHHDLFDVRGEWLDSNTERGVAEDGEIFPDQNIDSWYIQPSLRLSIIPVYAFNRLELVGRLANLDWGEGDKDQTTLGLNYYFNGSTALRLAWERIDETDRESGDSVTAMFALGF